MKKRGQKAAGDEGAAEANAKKRAQDEPEAPAPEPGVPKKAKSDDSKKEETGDAPRRRGRGRPPKGKSVKIDESSVAAVQPVEVAAPEEKAVNASVVEVKEEEKLEEPNNLEKEYAEELN